MSTPKGYIFAELVVTDVDHFYKEYMPRVLAPLEKYNAKFLIAGGNPAVLEGDRDVRRVVLLEFESPARAREFYYSPEYQEVIGYRFDSADTHLYLMEGSLHILESEPAPAAAG